MTEESVIADVIQRTGAEDAALLQKVTDNCWSIRLAFPDGPTAYTFKTILVDVSEDQLRIMGMPFL